jgi:hypothetical protein
MPKLDCLIVRIKHPELGKGWYTFRNPDYNGLRIDSTDDAVLSYVRVAEPHAKRIQITREYLPEPPNATS